MTFLHFSAFVAFSYIDQPLTPFFVKPISVFANLWLSLIWGIFAGGSFDYFLLRYLNFSQVKPFFKNFTLILDLVLIRALFFLQPLLPVGLGE